MRYVCLWLCVLGMAVLCMGCGAFETSPSQTESTTTATALREDTPTTGTTVPTKDTPAPDQATSDPVIAQTDAQGNAVAVQTDTTQTTAAEKGTSETATAVQPSADQTQTHAVSATTGTKPTGEPEIDFSQFE